MPHTPKMNKNNKDHIAQIKVKALNLSILINVCIIYKIALHS